MVFMNTTVRKERLTDQLTASVAERFSTIERATEIINPIHKDYTKGTVLINYNELYLERFISNPDILRKVADLYGCGQVKGVSVTAPKTYDWPGLSSKEVTKLRNLRFDNEKNKDMLDLEVVKAGLAKLIVIQTFPKSYFMKIVGNSIIEKWYNKSNPVELKAIVVAVCMTEAKARPKKEIKMIIDEALEYQKSVVRDTGNKINASISKYPPNPEKLHAPKIESEQMTRMWLSSQRK